MLWIAALMSVKGKVFFSPKNKKRIIGTYLLTNVLTGVYIEETLKSLTKPHIIDLFLILQEHTNSRISKLTDEIRNLYANFKRLA